METLKKLGIALIGLMLLIQPSPAENLSLQKLINTALENNPEIQASKYQYMASKEEITPAYFPPDPTFNVNFMNMPVGSFSFDRSPMSARQFSVMQMIPFPFKLSSKAKIKRNIMEVDKFKYELKTRQIELQIKVAYYKIAQLNKVIEIVKEKKEQLGLFETIAETKYKHGKGLQQDILKAKVNLAQITKKLMILEATLKAKTGEMVKLLGDKPVPEDIEFIYDEFEKKNKQELLQHALQTFPGIKMKNSMSEKADAMHSLSKWAYMPDFMIGAAYNSRSDSLMDGGTDSYSIMLGATIPLYSPFKQTGYKNSAKYMKEKAIKSRQDISDTVNEQVNSHYEFYRQNSDILQLYEEQIIPEARLALDSSLNAYQVDKVDFLNVLQSLLVLYSHYVDNEQAMFDVYKHWSFLEFYSGGVRH